jgi:hypothetical protein
VREKPMMPEEFVNENLKNLFKMLINIGKQPTNVQKNIFKEIEDEFKTMSPGDKERVRSFFNVLLNKLHPEQIS